ncbi:MAG: peptidase M48 [Alphaproteobacteria bacterium]|nr:peptidase M48 [Alphaproteobacteria bacterium]
MTLYRLAIGIALTGTLAAAIAGLQGCTVNPATGGQSFTGFMSPQDELRVGREQHPEVLQQFGGVYNDPALAAYVQQIGTALARHSEMPDLVFTFTVLNSPVVNAFALPGGYVYVTRGLMALASDEAELAGVLAHEIGHVTARHTAQRYSQSVLAAIGTTVLGAVIGDFAELAQLGATAYLQSYSRDQEFQADELGVRYLTRAGYQPRAMASFLTKLQEDSRIAAEAAGRASEADKFDLFATHPRTLDRVERALSETPERPLANARRGRDEYLARIDGMLYGDDPEHGFVRGRAFVHPALRFRFEVPPGFRLVNGERHVTAVGPSGAQIKFHQVKRDDASAMDHLIGTLARGLRLDHVEGFEVNGMEGATGVTQMRAKDGPQDVRLVAMRVDPTTFHRFLFYTPPSLTRSLTPDLQATIYSLQRLTEAEAARVRAQRIWIRTVQPGDTAEQFSAGMADDPFRLRRFANLNDLPPRALPRPGEKVKVVTE